MRIEEERCGFEPEVTGKIAAIPGCRIYEIGISYFGRTYEEGKKTGWRDGVRAAWCIWKYRPARLRRTAVRLTHLQPASKMLPERPTESSPRRRLRLGRLRPTAGRAARMDVRARSARSHVQHVPHVGTSARQHVQKVTLPALTKDARTCVGSRLLSRLLQNIEQIHQFLKWLTY